MKIESNPENAFRTDLSGYELVGFHATSRLAGQQIETHGFLPSKVFSADEQSELLTAAARLGVRAGAHESWLGMWSVTFSSKFDDAKNHITRGSSCGQGVLQMLAVVNAVESKGEERDRTLARRIIARIQQLQCSTPVIYAVDLSKVERLVYDERDSLFRLYWDTTKPLPQSSEVDPSRLIARLDWTP